MSNDKRVALTTFDNPYSPFDNFEEWFLFDVTHGYNSCEYLGRISVVSDMMSEQEENQEIERAIDEIIKYDFMNIYKKVTPEDFDNENKVLSDANEMSELNNKLDDTEDSSQKTS